MPGLFTQAGRVLADTRRKTQDIRQEDERAAIQRLAVTEGLRQQGLIPDEQAQQMQGAVQAAKATDFLTPGSDLSGVETPTVQKAGAGFSRVSTMTPEYRQRQVEQVKQRRAMEAEQATKTLMQRALAGDAEAKATLIARTPSLANSVFKEKTPQRYVPQTREEAISYERELAKARKVGGGGGGRPMTPQSAEEFAQSVADRAIAAANGDVRLAAKLATEDPAGREAYKRGLSTRHFNAAAHAFKQDQQAFAKRMQGGGRGDAGLEAAIAAVLDNNGGAGAPEPTQQQRDWDAAAAELRRRGVDPATSQIGQRP